MTWNKNRLATKTILLSAAAVLGAVLPHAVGQSAVQLSTKPAPTPYQFQPAHFSQREARYYEGFWGIDSLVVRYAESGELIRFSYRVIDASKATPLHDRKLEPSLLDPQARVKLVIPTLEKVGQLRQSSTPETGKSYWMAFSNKGRMVKPGDRVVVVIGNFRADGLIVE